MGPLQASLFKLNVAPNNRHFCCTNLIKVKWYYRVVFLKITSHHNSILVNYSNRLRRLGKERNTLTVIHVFTMSQRWAWVKTGLPVKLYCLFTEAKVQLNFSQVWNAPPFFPLAKCTNRRNNGLRWTPPLLFKSCIRTGHRLSSWPLCLLIEQQFIATKL